jgi:hypothetical protein
MSAEATSVVCAEFNAVEHKPVQSGYLIEVPRSSFNHALFLERRLKILQILG